MRMHDSMEHGDPTETSPRSWQLLDMLNRAGQLVATEAEKLLSGAASDTQNRLEATIVGLRQQLADVVAGRNTSQAATDEAATRLTAEYKAMSDALQAGKLTAASLQAKLDAAGAQIAALNSAMRTNPTSAQLADLRQQLASAQTDKTDAQLAAQSASNKLATAEAERAEYITAMEAKYREREAKLASGSPTDKAEVARLTRELQVLQGAHRASLDEIRHLQAQCEECAAKTPDGLVPAAIVPVVPTSAELAPVTPRPAKAYIGESYTPTRAISQLRILQSVSAANPDLKTLAHFANAPMGLWAHEMRESGLRWGTPPFKEAPRRGSTVARFSYGPIQLLDDTASGLVKRSSLIGPFAAKIKPIAESTGTPNAATAALLDQVDPGSYYIALFLAAFGRQMGVDFNMTDFLMGAPLARDPKKPAAADVTLIAQWINNLSQTLRLVTASGSIPAVDPVARMLRLYGGASSVPGMANSIRNGHADKSTAWLDKNMALLREEASRATTA